MESEIGGLRAFLAPRSVAVVGASNRPGSVGAAVFANLLQGGFAGPLWPVNPAHARIAGQAAWPDATALPAAPDLAIVCTPPGAVPRVIAELGAAGTRAAVVLTAGLDQPGADGHSLSDAMLAAAHAHGLRILGPNCVGLRVPRIGLNASFTAVATQPGPLALVAQSGGVITAFLGWARPRGIGVSCCVSLGNASDLTAADWLDALAADPQTGAILLYLESARDGRRFIEAARRAVRIKPVFALKVGRVREGAAVAATHTGAMAGADNVWEAALLAAGVRRLDSLQALYGVATILARMSTPPRDRLAIVTNSGGPAVLAVDALIAGGGSLAPLGAATIEALDARLPVTWSRCNPVDIIGDAQPARFVAALDCVTTDPAVDTTLVMHVPTDLAGAADVQRVCGEFAAQSGRCVIGCFMGDDADMARGAVLPAFDDPAQAVGAILHVAAAGRFRASLSGAADPASLVAASPVTPEWVPPADLSALRARLSALRQAGQQLVTGEPVERLLHAFGIPVVAVRIVASLDELPAVAATLGYPVVLKLQSPDVPHKSDVGGVVTGIADEARLVEAARQMLARVAALRPGARIEGFQLQRHVAFAHTRELIVGVSRDAEFGPVLLFGHGGTGVHVWDDTAIGIPPLDTASAAALIARTRVARHLAAWRDWPAADAAQLQHVLVAVARMALEVPEMRELDINPLLAHPEGVLALDARLWLA